MTEINADRHNAEVLAVRQRPSTFASTAPAKEKKKAKVKQQACWFHQKWGKEAKSCWKSCSWSGNGYWGGTKD